MKKRNLHGLRVLNTRPQQQSDLLSRTIIAAGGKALSCPALHIEPTPSSWLSQLPPLTDITYTIFISTNAIHFFYTTLTQHHIIWPTDIPTITIGKSSAQALSYWGITADACPLIANSEHVLKLPLLQHIEKKICLIIKGEGGLTIIEDTLKQRGADVISLAVYQRTLPVISPEKIKQLWQDDLVDIILITSEQALHNIFTLFGNEALTWLYKKPYLVISQRLADAAYRLGIQNVIVSSYDSLLDALEAYYKLHKGLRHDAL